MNLSILGIIAGNRIHKVINCSFEIESIGFLLLVLEAPEDPASLALGSYHPCLALG